MDIEILMTGPAGQARILAAQIKNMLLEPGDRMIVKHCSGRTLGERQSVHHTRVHAPEPTIIMDVLG